MYTKENDLNNLFKMMGLDLNFNSKNDNIEYFIENEKNKNSKIIIFLPGYNKNDLTIEIAGDELKIHSNIEKETRIVKKFNISFKISNLLNKKNVNVTFINGILTIEFKYKKIENRSIKIN